MENLELRVEYLMKLGRLRGLLRRREVVQSNPISQDPLFAEAMR